MWLWISLATAGDAWRPGLEALDVGLPSEALPAQRCSGCHAEEHREWEGSRHHVSHTNTLYQAGLMAEPRPFCVYCHSPLEQQAAEILPNLPWYGSHDPRRPVLGPPPTRGPETLSGEGVGCVVCHVRDGVIHGSGDGGIAPHPVRSDPGLTDGSLCRGCHEFAMPKFSTDGIALTEVLMQSTWSEWKAWGGEERCVDCHMPEGSHQFRGANDRELLAGAVDVDVRRRAERLVFSIRSQGVGHNVPTGDLFRNLTLEVQENGAWTRIDRIGRRFELEIDPVTGAVEKRLVADTSLRPGEPRVASVHAPDRTAWRLVFHYGAAHDEARGLVPAEDLTAVVAEGER